MEGGCKPSSSACSPVKNLMNKHSALFAMIILKPRISNGFGSNMSNRNNQSTDGSDSTRLFTTSDLLRFCMVRHFKSQDHTFQFSLT